MLSDHLEYPSHASNIWASISFKIILPRDLGSRIKQSSFVCYFFTNGFVHLKYSIFLHCFGACEFVVLGLTVYIRDESLNFANVKINLFCRWNLNQKKYVNFYIFYLYLYKYIN